MTTAAVMTTNRPRVPAEAPPSPLSLREFVEASGLRSLVVGVSKDPNAKITVLLLSTSSGNPVYAIKAPTTDVAARAVEAERRVLAGLHRSAPRDVVETVPRVVRTVEFDGRPALVMTAVPGTPMSTEYLRWRHTATPARVSEDFAAVSRWLAGLQRETAGPLSPIDMAADVESRLRARFAEDARLAGDLDRLAEIDSRLRHSTTPRTVVHGDLWLANVLLTEGRASGVVDWEAGTASGEPVRDLARFALMYALYLDRRTRAGRRVAGHAGLRAGAWGAGVEFALDGSGWFPDLFRRFLAEGLDRLGASPDCWRDVALAAIAEVAALTDNQEFARDHLELFRRVTGRAGDGKEIQ